MQFWPRGDRVRVEIEVPSATNATTVAPARWPAECFIFDTQTGTNLPETGWIFTGSRKIQEGDREIYVADEIEPQAIISVFNLAATVLDVPRYGSQDALYDRQRVAEARRLPPGTPVRVILSPWPIEKGGQRSAICGFVPGTNDDVGARWEESEGDRREVYTGRDAVEAHLRAARERGDLVFARFAPAADLPLAQVAQAARLFGDWERAEWLRGDAPQGDDFYFAAFTPDASFRDRATRPAQPAEIRLALLQDPPGAWEATVCQADATDGRPIRDASDLAEAVRALPPTDAPGVLLIFAPPSAPLSALRDALRHVRATHPVLYFFADR